jgi:hypothetical protein
MQFEEAERLHQRVERIREVQGFAGELAASLDRLNGVAVVPSADPEAVDLWFMTAATWREPRRLQLAEQAGQSMDHRLREMIAGIGGRSEPSPEHLAILLRWQGSTWRDGEWIGFDSTEKIPYRRLVNAINRVHRAAK